MSVFNTLNTSRNIGSSSWPDTFSPIHGLDQIKTCSKSTFYITGNSKLSVQRNCAGLDQIDLSDNHLYLLIHQGGGVNVCIWLVFICVIPDKKKPSIFLFIFYLMD